MILPTSGQQDATSRSQDVATKKHIGIFVMLRLRPKLNVSVGILGLHYSVTEHKIILFWNTRVKLVRNHAWRAVVDGIENGLLEYNVSRKTSGPPSKERISSCSPPRLPALCGA